jgi:hypothetical protein
MAMLLRGFLKEFFNRRIRSSGRAFFRKYLLTS